MDAYKPKEDTQMGKAKPKYEDDYENVQLRRFFNEKREREEIVFDVAEKEPNEISFVEQSQPAENPAFKTWEAISPKHYKDIIPGYEYMDMMEHILSPEEMIGHLKGQVFKYMLRMGKKDDILLESGKVEWYAKRLHDVIKRQRESNNYPVKAKLA
jgi:hypothetical protein